MNERKTTGLVPPAIQQPGPGAKPPENTSATKTQAERLTTADLASAGGSTGQETRAVQPAQRTEQHTARGRRQLSRSLAELRAGQTACGGATKRPHTLLRPDAISASSRRQQRRGQ